ncbi:MAG TPA: L,D-transpeptidase family protein [Candidatus Acidoferrum sp.]|nr:L,D-transpeptidase family protein [Candidatus Acidoferrum sp.]
MTSRNHLRSLSFALFPIAFLCSAPRLAHFIFRSTQSSSVAAASIPPQPLSPAGQAELRSIVDSGNFSELRWPDFSDYRKYVQEFYASYQYSLPWVRDMQPSPQAGTLIARFQTADTKGLNPEDYDGSRWAARIANLAPANRNPKEIDAIHFDVAMTITIMRYISDLHIGRVNPQHLDFNLDVNQKKLNLPEFLAADVVDSNDLENILTHVEPPFPGYWRTQRALQTYRALVAKQSPPLPMVKIAVKPGGTYADVAGLANFLKLVGDLPADATIAENSTLYEGPVVDGVKHFQSRHGLTPDGVLGAKTIEEMNVPFSSRVTQIELTLERWRWLPISFGGAPIVVNIPEFRLRAYDDDLRLAFTMNVVVGKAYNHLTPVFTGRIQYVIIRPYWNVPYSIVKAEILPALARNPNYLQKENFEIVDARQNPVGAGEVTPEILQQLRAGRLMIRQKPGPKNSLGLIKFMFPNDFDVYMHDTPATSLFSRSRRDFSHGCIRLERPVDLAVWVLRNNPGWDAAKIRAAMNGNQTVRVDLAKSIPVIIIYGTVFVADDGTVHFFDDIYGHDAALEQALASGYPYPS